MMPEAKKRPPWKIRSQNQPDEPPRWTISRLKRDGYYFNWTINEAQLFALADVTQDAIETHEGYLISETVQSDNPNS